MQVNIEMWGGGSSSEIEEVSSTLARCFSERSDNLRYFVHPLVPGSGLLWRTWENLRIAWFRSGGFGVSGPVGPGLGF